jgi:hypothetical protein
MVRWAIGAVAVNGPWGTLQCSYFTYRGRVSEVAGGLLPSSVRAKVVAVLDNMKSHVW